LASATLCSAAIYARSAFFFYPWTPIVQLLIGKTYAVGHAFFWCDRSEPNLHLFALAWQLENLGRLHFLDFGYASNLPEGSAASSRVPTQPLLSGHMCQG